MFKKQDPDYVGFTGTLKTDLRLGEGDALVEVELKIVDDETVEYLVMYRGVDVTDLMHLTQLGKIDAYFDNKWQELIQNSKQEAKWIEP